MRNPHYLYLTLHLSGEGSRDKSFAEYLYKLYHIERLKVKFSDAKGGSPLKQIKDMRTMRGAKGFDKHVAMYDIDRGEDDVNAALAEAKNDSDMPIQSLLARNNIECEILRLTNAPAKVLQRAMVSADAAKHEFKKFFKLKDEDAVVEWEKHFSKEYLDEARKTNSWLNAIIDTIEGNWVDDWVIGNQWGEE